MKLVAFCAVMCVLAFPVAVFPGTGTGAAAKNAACAKLSKAAPKSDVANAGMYLRFAKEMGLSEEQVKTLERIRADYRKEAQSLNILLKSVQAELSLMLEKDNPDFIAARLKAQELADLNLRLKNALIDVSEKSYSILSPEQNEALLRTRAEVKEKKKIERKSKQ